LIVEIAPDLNITIDDVDKRIVEKRKWYLHSNKRSIIACFWDGDRKRTFTLGRYILSEYGHIFDENELVCYKDHDFLNNKKSNLVVRTKSENNKNRRPKMIKGSLTRRSLPYGVYRNKKGKKYSSAIRIKGKLIWLGSFASKNNAERATSEAVERFGYQRKSNG
jgi:hypothetical protein